MFLERVGRSRGCTDLNLLHPRPLEAEVKAVVGEGAYLGVVAVVAHADDGDLGVLDEQKELGHAPSVLVARHAVHLVHHQAVSVAVRRRAAARLGTCVRQCQRSRSGGRMNGITICRQECDHAISGCQTSIQDSDLGMLNLTCRQVRDHSTSKL